MATTYCLSSYMQLQLVCVDNSMQQSCMSRPLKAGHLCRNEAMRLSAGCRCCKAAPLQATIPCCHVLLQTVTPEDLHQVTRHQTDLMAGSTLWLVGAAARLRSEKKAATIRAINRPPRIPHTHAVTTMFMVELMMCSAEHTSSHDPAKVWTVDAAGAHRRLNCFLCSTQTTRSWQCQQAAPSQTSPAAPGHWES